MTKVRAGSLGLPFYYEMQLALTPTDYQLLSGDAPAELQSNVIWANSADHSIQFDCDFRNLNLLLYMPDGSESDYPTGDGAALFSAIRSARGLGLVNAAGTLEYEYIESRSDEIGIKMPNADAGLVLCEGVEVAPYTMPDGEVKFNGVYFFWRFELDPGPGDPGLTSDLSIPETVKALFVPIN